MWWLKRYFADLVGAHVDGLRVARGLPLLFAIMVAWEFGQHIVEVRIGLFDSETAAKAVSQDGSRMALGWIKMILVYAGGFFAIRYLVWGSSARTLAVSRRTVLRYLPYVAYSLILFALIFYAGSFIAADRVMAFRATIGLAQVLIEPLLMLWIVSAATDGPVGGPLQSATLTGRHYLWALALFFVARLPTNAAHQLLNRYAIGQPPALVWAMLAIDAVVVGLLVAIVPAIYVRVTRLVMERRGPAG